MNMTRFNRLWLLGSLMLLWVALKPQILFAQVDTPVVTLVATPEPSSDRIDLTIDKEADGMPDELQAALDQLNAVYDAYLQEDGTLRDDPEAQAALREAEIKFRDRLPYSDQTRSTQARIGEIYLALTKNPDPEMQTRLLAELQAMEVQLQTDSNFALVDQVLSRRVIDALNAKIEADQTKTPIPTVTPEATPSPAESIAGEDPLVQSAAINQPGLLQRLANAWTALFPRELCASNQAPDFTVLVRGQIMFMGLDSAVPNYFYAKKYNHIALYDGELAGVKQVYEAWHQGVGVVRRSLATLWNSGGACIAFARVENTDDAQRQAALDWAKLTYNTNGTTPYNFNFINKNTNAALYCSQLVWKTFGHLGINLDSNNVDYRNWLVARHSFGDLILGIAIIDAANDMVAPDEIALHGDMRIYHERQNP